MTSLLPLTDEMMIKIEQDLHDDIEETEAKLAAIDRRLPVMQDEAHEAERQAEKTGKPGDQTRADNLSRTLADALQASTATSLRLKTLRAPEELERRIAEKTHTMERIGKLTEATKDKKAAKPTAKDQGFPSGYLGENGNFKPGLDARAKSDLINCVLGIESKDSIFSGTAAEAQKLIDVRGWQPFLARKREIVEEKKKNAETKAAEKAKAAEEKAAAKKTAAAAKSESGDGNDVTPDPKPTSTKKTGRKVGA